MENVSGQEAEVFVVKTERWEMRLVQSGRLRVCSDFRLA